MGALRIQILPRAAVAGTLFAAAAVVWWIAPVAWKGSALSLPSLAIGSALATVLAVTSPREPPIRLASAFVLCALVATPAPGGLIVAAVAALFGSNGLAGTKERRLIPSLWLASVLIALQGFTTLLETDVVRAPFLAFVHICVVYLLLHAAVWLGARAEGRAEQRQHRVLAHALTLESANIPLAWVLAVVTTSSDVPAAVLPLSVTLVVLAASALRAADRHESRLQQAHAELSQRTVELATLHSIGREIVASLDLRRVIVMLDRECRKILDVDEFSIALADTGSSRLRLAYRRERAGVPEEDDVEITEGLETLVARARAARRIDDLEGLESEATVMLRRRFGSAVVAPLIVDNRVIGVLAVRCDRTHAYDDHRVTFLTTIGQQAAVAIENARHYLMATRDSLTGLYLRDYFFRRVEEEFHRSERYGTPFALLMIDLDDFKRINDEHGHQVGDRFLSAIARSIREHLRAADLACRFGGDEFCILLPETDRDGALAIAERLREGIRAVAQGDPGSSRRTTSASIGIAGFPEDADEDLSTLLRRADEALYRAKHSGRDRVVAWSATGPAGVVGRRRKVDVIESATGN